MLDMALSEHGGNLGFYLLFLEVRVTVGFNIDWGGVRKKGNAVVGGSRWG